MSLIKRQFAEPALKDAIVLDLGDITRQAKQIRDAAEIKAKQIVAEAHKAAEAEATAAHNDASDKGFAEGLAKGIEEGRKDGYEAAIKEHRPKLKQIEDSWNKSITEWDSIRDQVDREAHHSILQLALRLGEKIVRRQIEVDRDVAARQISDALSHVLRQVEVIARICPDDRSMLEDALPKLSAGFTHLKHIRLKDDPSVTRGGCVLQYGQGQIDATIETQLQRIVEMLIPDPVVQPTNQPNVSELSTKESSVDAHDGSKSQAPQDGNSLSSPSPSEPISDPLSDPNTRTPDDKQNTPNTEDNQNTKPE